jgi:hypothetical protein
VPFARLFLSLIVIGVEMAYWDAFLGESSAGLSCSMTLQPHLFVRFGLLHRIPFQKGKDPGGLFEEDEFLEPADEEEEIFVPADMQNSFSNRGHIPPASSHRHKSPSSDDTDEEYNEAADRTYTHAGRASNLIAPVPSRPYTNGDSQHP